ncbi:transposase, partial [Paracoccus bogoriensis]|nr:transposase [Paracoccus bogoriensis]
RANEDAQRLQTIPGIGPVTAGALVSALPDIGDVRSGRQSGRDLSAWLGLTARPHATGGNRGPERDPSGRGAEAAGAHLGNGQQVSAQSARPG